MLSDIGADFVNNPARIIRPPGLSGLRPRIIRLKFELFSVLGFIFVCTNLGLSRLESGSVWGLSQPPQSWETPFKGLWQPPLYLRLETLDIDLRLNRETRKAPCFGVHIVCLLANLLDLFVLRGVDPIYLTVTSYCSCCCS